MNLSISQMRAVLRDYHAGKDVPRWVKAVMEPDMAGHHAPEAVEGPAPAPAVTAPGPADKLHAAALKLMDAGSSSERITAANEIASMMDSITDRSLLIEAAVHCNHKYLSHSLLEKIGQDAEALHRISQEAVFEPAAADAMERLCRMVGSITSIEILGSIAEKGVKGSAKAEAAASLATKLDSLEPGSLKLVAMNAADELTRSKAVERLAGMAGGIRDPSILKIIAVHSSDPEARRTALCGLTGNFHSIKTVAICSTYKQTRIQALGLLGRDSDVFEVAMEALDDDVAAEAARALSRDVGSLVRLYDLAPRKAVRDAAAACLCAMAGELFTLKPLKIVALTGVEQGRSEAVEKLASMVHDLDDRNALLYVALWSRGWQARRHALNALSDDREALGLIAQMCEHDDSKRMASRLLAQPQESRPS